MEQVRIKPDANDTVEEPTPKTQPDVEYDNKGNPKKPPTNADRQSDTSRQTDTA